MKKYLPFLFLLPACQALVAQSPIFSRIGFDLAGFATRQFQISFGYSHKSEHSSVELMLGAHFPAIDRSQVFHGEWINHYSIRKTYLIYAPDYRFVGESTTEYVGAGQPLPELPPTITKTRVPILIGYRRILHADPKQTLRFFLQPALGFSWNQEYNTEDILTVTGSWSGILPAENYDPLYFRETSLYRHKQTRYMRLETRVAPAFSIDAGLQFSPWRRLFLEGRAGLYGAMRLPAAGPARYEMLYINELEPRIQLIAGWRL